MSEGQKDDQGKDPWHLAPFDAFQAVIKILNYGQRKYSARGWEQGMDWSRVFDALMRHMTAWWERENEGVDEESGYSHLWHAGCCVMFLIAYEIRGVGRDNRP